MSTGRTIQPSLRTWALAAAAAAVATTTLAAQKEKTQASQPIHIPLGAIHDAKEEARIRAGIDSSTRWLKVYRVETTPEVTLAYIRQDLGGGRGPRPDSAALRPGETSPITYTVAFHKFADQCMDPPASSTAASSTGTACRVWRRGQAAGALESPPHPGAGRLDRDRRLHMVQSGHEWRPDPPAARAPGHGTGRRLEALHAADTARRLDYNGHAARTIADGDPRSYLERRTSTSINARNARPRCDTRCFAARDASANVIPRSVDQNNGS